MALRAPRRLVGPLSPGGAERALTRAGARIAGPLAGALLLACGAADPPAPGSDALPEGAPERCGVAKRRVSRGNAGAYEVSLTPEAGGFALSWYDTRDGNAEIYFARVDSAGAPVLSETRVFESPEQSYEPSLARSGDRYGLAWYEVDEETPAGHGADDAFVRFGVVDARGRALAVTRASAHADPERNPHVLADDAGFVVLWLRKGEAPAVIGRRFERSGAPAGDAVELGAASPESWAISGRLRGGEVLAVLNARGNARAEEVHLIRAAADLSGAVQTRLTADDGHDSLYPDLALGRDGALVVWWDRRDGDAEVYAADLDLDAGALATPERLTRTPGTSTGAYATAAPGGYAVAYDDDTPGDREVFAVLLGDRGRRERVRVSCAPCGSFVPAIAWNGEALGVAWNDFCDASSDDDFARADVYFAALPPPATRPAATPARRGPRERD